MDDPDFKQLYAKEGHANLVLMEELSRVKAERDALKAENERLRAVMKNGYHIEDRTRENNGARLIFKGKIRDFWTVDEALAAALKGESNAGLEGAAEHARQSVASTRDVRIEALKGESNDDG